MYYVYVLRSESDEMLYIGYTKDLRRRFKEHNDKKSFSTSYRGPFELIYYEAFRAQKDATEREKKLKQFKSTYGQLKKRLWHSLNESQNRGGKIIL